MIELLQRYFPPVHRHPKKHAHQWKDWRQHDPLLADLQPHEHGIVLRLTVESITENGLILDGADSVFNVRVA